ncbi:MAG: carboxy-S-adenosyl-L-methionine synthase CmoA [Oligoflexales bacterium]
MQPSLQLNPQQDQLFDSNHYPVPFEFDSQVAHVFDDMAVRSIPLYAQVMHNTVEWVQRSCSNHARIYDLGCSTGTLIRALVDQVSFPLELIGVDNSEHMLAQAQQKLSGTPNIQWIAADLLQIPLEPCSAVIMNYTLQFLSEERRALLLKRIFTALKPGGIFLYSEKTLSSNATIQHTMTDIYHKFKHQNGYSKNEIERKKEALEKVLIPWSTQKHLQELTCAGFLEKNCDIALKWNAFTTFIAKKPEGLPC